MTGMGDLIFGILTMLALIGTGCILLGWFDIFGLTIVLIITTLLFFLSGRNLEYGIGFRQDAIHAFWSCKSSIMPQLTLASTVFHYDSEQGLS